jgi:cystathionine beta-lyase/cystathionine gamma-synthase
VFQSEVWDIITERIAFRALWLAYKHPFAAAAAVAAAAAAALPPSPAPQVVYCESVSNPTLVVADLPALADIAHAGGVWGRVCVCVCVGGGAAM